MIIQQVSYRYTSNAHHMSAFVYIVLECRQTVLYDHVSRNCYKKREQILSDDSDPAKKGVI